MMHFCTDSWQNYALETVIRIISTKLHAHPKPCKQALALSHGRAEGRAPKAARPAAGAPALRGCAPAAPPQAGAEGAAAGAVRVLRAECCHPVGSLSLVSVRVTCWRLWRAPRCSTAHLYLGNREGLWSPNKQFPEKRSTLKYVWRFIQELEMFLNMIWNKKATALWTE